MARDVEGRKVELEKRLEYLRAKRRELAESDPFWFYEPYGSGLGGEQRGLLGRWLREGDIPDRVDGQVDVFRSKADIRGVWGGNQGGKTVILTISSLIAVTGAVPFALEGVFPKELLPKKWPVYARIVGIDHKSFLGNLKPAFQYWVPREYLKGGKWTESWSAEQNTLSLYRNGGEFIGFIEFMTNQQDVESFQGPARHFVGYDEEPRHDIYKENLMRFTTAERLNVMFAMTPTGGMQTWVKDEIVDKAENSGGSIECFKLTSVGNKKANLQVLEEILKGLSTYEEIQMRLLGSFVSLSGLVYGKTFNRRVHVVDDFPITKDFMVVRGIDPHLVKPTVCVELAVDRMGNEYVVGVYSKDGDTEEIKKDLAERARERGYRLGWTMCDKSADSTLRVLGDRNVFRELSTGKNAIPALFTSEKYTGSINAGVDEIKQLLRCNETTGKPRLYFFNTPENRVLINAMETMEREIHANEDRKGIADKIAEGKHDAHAALRYIHQRTVRWVPPQVGVPEYVPVSNQLGY